MKTILSQVILLISAMTLLAQPGDSKVLINEAAYSQPFLHCVPDEKYFAQYAVEAKSGIFELDDTILCKLHIPRGLNNVWQDIEKSSAYPKGEFDFSNDFWTGIRFNFYLNGVKVSTAYQPFQKPAQHAGAFTYVFNLNPHDFSTGAGDIPYAYQELLKNMQEGFSQVVIEAAMPSKNLLTKAFVPITSTMFSLKFDAKKYAYWKKQRETAEEIRPIYGEATNNLDYNLRLRYLGDSAMTRIFGAKGLSENFSMTCLQNPCENGYLYANTFFTHNDCTSSPQNSCKEAILTYKYKKEAVPLTIKMLVTMKENGNYVQIENNAFGNKEIPLEKQKILSLDEMNARIKRQFKGDSLALLTHISPLAYSAAKIKKPEKNVYDKINRDPGYTIIKETKASKKWEKGFIYTARNTNPEKSSQIYTFDATTGELLCITEFYNVAD